MSLRDLCYQAGVPCRASGAWCDRQVGYIEAPTQAIRAEPNPQGSVLITVPIGLSDRDRARWMLAAMAYAVFDGVARESIRGAPWTREIETASGVFCV